MTQPAVLVLVTAPTLRESRRLAKVLVTERLAACVNISREWQSVYRWRGKIEKSSEHLLLIKTPRARLSGVIGRVLALHPYAVPEIIALPIRGGNSAYLSWLTQETQETNVKG